MHTRTNSYPTGSRHVHYSGFSVVPLGTPMGLEHQRDDRVDNRHGIKPRRRHRFNSQDYTISHDIERRTPTATGADVDRTHWQDIGRALYRQPERATPRQERERRSSFDWRQHRSQASISSLPRTVAVRAPSNGVNQSYIPTRAIAQTVLSQARLDLPDEYHQLPQAERHRLRAILPPPIPLVPKDPNPTFLERLNPFRRIRSLSTPSTVPKYTKYTTIVVIPSENSAQSRCRSIARRP